MCENEDDSQMYYAKQKSQTQKAGSYMISFI